jgi:hypothetical protein
LLIDGKTDDITKKPVISSSLKYYGADHYVKARERGYILYVEGSTDVDMLHALAEKLNHSVLKIWDERVNTYYVRNNYPTPTLESEIERVEEGYEKQPKEHYLNLRQIIPDLKGLALLDADDKSRPDSEILSLKIAYWKKYELENYFITPELLKEYALLQFKDEELFGGFRSEIDGVLDSIVLSDIFDGNQGDFDAWHQSPPSSMRLVWEAKTLSKKLSAFAETFFRELAGKTGGQILLKKGEFHRLIPFSKAETIPNEVSVKLSLLEDLFNSSRKLPTTSTGD